MPDGINPEPMEQLLEALPETIQESKPGLKTTEFGLTAVALIATQVGALDLPGEYSQTIATVAIVVAYILSRGIAKAGVPNIPAP